EGHEYEGIRFHIEGVLEKLRQTIKIDISTGYAIIPAAVKLSNGELREAVTADYFRRPCLSDRAVGSAKARCPRRNGGNPSVCFWTSGTPDMLKQGYEPEPTAFVP
ncbi:MAG: hypothetical protein K6E83_13465, partial [Clostridium sp.]|nr:hypothetical protein [Clostridium sp.]